MECNSEVGWLSRCCRGSCAEFVNIEQRDKTSPPPACRSPPRAGSCAPGKSSRDHIHPWMDMYIITRFTHAYTLHWECEISA